MNVRLPFPFAVGLLTGAMGLTMFWCQRSESLTWDEPIHISAGVVRLATGVNTLNREHPPVVKVLCALPVVLAGVRLPVGMLPENSFEAVPWANELIYANGVSAATLVTLARLPAIALTMVLGILLAVFVKARYGEAAALLALGFFSLDPNFLAHGRLVTTDVAAALGIFASCFLWARDLEQPSPRRFVLAVVAFGVAINMKFSAVALFGLLPVIALLQTRSLRFLPRFFALCAAGLVAVVFVYDFTGTTPLSLSHPWVLGLSDVLEHSREGHVSFFLGKVNDVGSHAYFPVAFLVKSPLGSLAAFAIAAWVLRRGLPPLVWAPPLAIFNAAAASHINLGLRHILPVYPFLYAAVALAWAQAGPRVRKALLVCLLLHAGEGLAVAPNHLGFFNLAAGGMEHGDHWLLDSNLDWGQDIAKVPRWLDAHGYPRIICSAFFTSAPVERFGLIPLALPATGEMEARRRLDCIGLISLTPYHDVYTTPGRYRWLREEHRPIGRIGASILVFDLRRKGSKARMESGKEGNAPGLAEQAGSNRWDANHEARWKEVRKGPDSIAFIPRIHPALGKQRTFLRQVTETNGN